MKEIYEKIWELAKPYYERGRPMDIDHIEWMMQDALLVCEKEGTDDTLLLPLVILHDVGYAEVPKDDPTKLEMRKAHMKAGAKIAKEILEKAKYPSGKAEKIEYYVSAHDNWAFGDDEYKRDKLLGAFKDLDFIWMATPKGFPAMMKVLGKNKKEMIKYVESRPEEENFEFSCQTTKELFERYLNDRRKEIK